MPHKDPAVAKEYFATRHAARRELHLVKMKEHYQANKEGYLVRSRKAHLKNTYGLSIEDYTEMLIKQDYKCAICNQKEVSKTKTGDIKPLSVDHCHETGKVRALLCNACNFMIGFSRDDCDNLRNAIAYLEKYMQPDFMGLGGFRGK